MPLALLKSPVGLEKKAKPEKKEHVKLAEKRQPLFLVFPNYNYGVLVRKICPDASRLIAGKAKKPQRAISLHHYCLQRLMEVQCPTW